MKLKLPKTAIEEIEFAMKDQRNGAIQSANGYAPMQVRSGKCIPASGSASRALAYVPIYVHRNLQRTDSAFIPLGMDPHDDQDGRVRAFRKFKFHRMPGLMVQYDSFCHADRRSTVSNYLLYRRDGLLHAVVMLHAPCPESRDIAYHVYEWDEHFFLKEIKSWFISTSEFAEETGIEVKAYRW